MEFAGQKGQDRWIVEEIFPGIRGGWFLDLAASDGVHLSNTLVLERDLDWQGLCIEPNPESVRKLRQNRNCAISNACVDETRRTVDFLPNGELGGIIDDDTDNSRRVRGKLVDENYAIGKVLTLQTVTLADILAHRQAPAIIEYFSFDVEGAETRILRKFPFDRWTFLAMTIERPTPELNALLFANGYLFVKNERFDSFYVHETLPNLERVARQPFEQIPPKYW